VNNSINALITGGTGFIGKNLVSALLKMKFNCRLLLRSSSNGSFLDNCGNVEFWEGDLTEPKALEGIGKDIDYVFHLAAEGHVSAVSEEAYKRFRSVNVEGTRNLIEECAKHDVKKFVHFSSTAAMGLIRKKLVSEADMPEPKTPYQKSKLESETSALALGSQLGVPVVVLRPCMVYGAGGKGEFYKICRLMKRGFFPKVGLGRNLTPLVHVKDVVQGAIKAAERGTPGEVYLITSERSISESELRGIVREAWGGRPFHPYVPVWLMYLFAYLFEAYAKISGKAPLATRRNIANTVWDREFSIEKAKRELGYEPLVDFSKGISETINWYKSFDQS
jgi:nucleoside-diphosphate-sugar epimerase